MRPGMSIADRRGARRVVPTFLSYGFRPFFLMGALWSAAALLVWIVIFVVDGSRRAASTRLFGTSMKCCSVL
jgi:uncharacterized protein involved in response to NO